MHHKSQYLPHEQDSILVTKEAVEVHRTHCHVHGASLTTCALL